MEEAELGGRRRNVQGSRSLTPAVGTHGYGTAGCKNVSALKKHIPACAQNEESDEKKDGASSRAEEQANYALTLRRCD